jgi:hypothetical protein
MLYRLAAKTDLPQLPVRNHAVLFSRQIPRIAKRLMN